MLLALNTILLCRMAWEDFKDRAIYLFWFPVLGIVWYWLNGFSSLQNMIINLSWLCLNVLVLTIYFSIKQGQFINITKNYLGWGDLLLLLVASLFLSTKLYLALAILSFVLALVCSRIFRQLTIPLAGYFALVLAVTMLIREAQPGIF